MDDDYKGYVFRAAHYDVAVENLMADPIIQQMAAEIPPQDIHLTEYNGFMQLALNEYRKRGGKVDCHIGGPSEAIRKIIALEKQEQDIANQQDKLISDYNLDPQGE